MSCVTTAELIDLTFALWTQGGPKETQVLSHLAGCGNVPLWEDTLTPPGEYD